MRSLETALYNTSRGKVLIAVVVDWGLLSLILVRDGTDSVNTLKFSRFINEEIFPAKDDTY